MKDTLFASEKLIKQVQTLYMVLRRMQKSVLTNEALKYRNSAQWWRTKPGILAIAVNKLLKDRETGGSILDAGAGFGLDSAYFARKGFQVKAVEINPGAIPYILENAQKHHVENKVEIINRPIQEAIKIISSDSLVAILDSGMSHALNDEDKNEYAGEVFRCLKPGGLFALSHFSEHEEENPAKGRGQDYLRKLFPESKFGIIRNWKEHKWVSLKTGKMHSIWRVIFRKKFV